MSEPTDEVAAVAGWLRHDADRIHDWTPDGVAIRLHHYADRLDAARQAHGEASELSSEAIDTVLTEAFGTGWRNTVRRDEVRFLRYCWPYIEARVRAETAFGPMTPLTREEAARAWQAAQDAGLVATPLPPEEGT